MFQKRGHLGSFLLDDELVLAGQWFWKPAGVSLFLNGGGNRHKGTKVGKYLAFGENVGESCWPFSEYSKAAKYTLKNDIKIHFQLAWSWVCSLKVFFLTISHIQLEMSFRSPVCLSYLRWEFSVYIFLLSCLSFLLSFSTKEVLFNSVFLCLRFILVSMLFICGVITWTTMKSCGHFVKNAGDRLQNILYNWTIQLRHWDVYLYTGMCV